MTLQTDVLIIGAGISGITLAQKLTAAGRQCIVLDKGRGVGGRMSTRRREQARFDHGAQFITVRDERVQQIINDLVARGVVREWFRSDADQLPRYCGTQGMSSIVSSLAADCNVRTSTEVISLSHDGAQWNVHCASGEVFFAPIVVSSAPVPQTRQLLERGNVHINVASLHVLDAVRYERCIASLVTCATPVNVRAIKHPDIAFIGDNYDKGISTVPAYTIHATPEFSERMWDHDRHILATTLARCVFGDTLEGVLDIDVQAWKFSRPQTHSMATFMRVVDAPSLILVGDAFGGPRVEGAMISALDAATYLMG